MRKVKPETHADDVLAALEGGRLVAVIRSTARQMESGPDGPRHTCG